MSEHIYQVERRAIGIFYRIDVDFFCLGLFHCGGPFVRGEVDYVNRTETNVTGILCTFINLPCDINGTPPSDTVSASIEPI